MTESEQTVARLQAKFNKTGSLTGDEDFELEVAREQINKRSRSKSVVTQAEVDRIAKRAFAKAQAKFSKSMHLSDEDEQHLRNLRDTVKAAAEHVDKISFDDRKPEGSELETRNPETDGTMPAKSAKSSGIDANMLKGKDLARLVGTACAKAAQFRPMNMNPARANEDLPTAPFKPLSVGDAGGDLDGSTRAELENAARAGNAAAQAKLIQGAMRPFMMSRY
jgi:hypothetical protein